jgi:pimeloyl-ACP methyl ester carboxylesterase
VPGGVTRSEAELDRERGVRAYVYDAGGEAGVYLVAPGLHYAGPDDPRLDRFCRVLARVGFVVVAPFLPDFLALRVAPTATRDLTLALEHAIAIADARRLPGPAVFSVSFGSRPAIEICATELGARVTSLVLFGGFCDFEATVRFAVTGRAEHEGAILAVPFDPLNAPVVHLNLLPFLEEATEPAALTSALREMVVRTWGRPEMKVGEARASCARAIAEGLLEDDRPLFLTACGLEGDAEALLERGLAAAKGAFAWADPRPHLAGLRPPVVIVHGRDDDVIPFTEASKLAAALPPGHPRAVILTGLYAHTGTTVPGPRTALREAAALIRVVRVLGNAARGSAGFRPDLA